MPSHILACPTRQLVRLLQTCTAPQACRVPAARTGTTALRVAAARGPLTRPAKQLPTSSLQRPMSAAPPAAQLAGSLASCALDATSPASSSRPPTSQPLTPPPTASPAVAAAAAPAGSAAASAGAAAPAESPTAGAESAAADPLVQYVVLRADLWKELGWPLGSVVAQACHAATAALWQARAAPDTAAYCAPGNLDHMHKVVLEVKGEAQLRNLAAKLAEAGVAAKLWVEQPENFATCVATAPGRKSALAAHFKKLKLCKGL